MRSRVSSLQTKLFWAFTLVTVIAVALPAVFFRNALYADRVAFAGKEALARAVFARNMLEENPTEEEITRLFDAGGECAFRMTLVDGKGKVLRDSHVARENLPALENHGNRPEIQEAFATGKGISLRRSKTLGYETVYAAVRLVEGGALRVAVPMESIRESLAEQIPAFLALVGGVGLFCLLLSAVLTAKFRRRMDEMAEVVASISRDTGGQGQLRLHDIRWREMRPLACAVNHMADTIEAYVETTTDQQSQLETILDSMHEGVLVLGPSGTIRRWNRALARLFPDIAGAEGKPPIEGIPFPLLQSRVDALLARKAGSPGGPQQEEAIHFEIPSGRFLVAHVSSPATRNESLGAVIVIYDVTDLMRLERVRRDFVSNVSHELRTPLTAIGGYAETLMASEDLSEEYRKFAGIIHKHANSLAKVTSDLLALARVENTRETVELSAADAEPAARDAVTAVREQAEAKRISITLDLEPVPVLANVNLLTQVFRNLLENACRYSPEGGMVRVFSRRQGGEVLFCVTDNGPGIPAEALPRIFERFYQVRKERNSGTAGIGLAICKHIIERHSGRIWAESPYGEAATAMLFTLLAAPAEE